MKDKIKTNPNIKEKLNHYRKCGLSHKCYSEDLSRRIIEGEKISKRMGSVKERELLDATSVNVEFRHAPFGSYYYHETAIVNCLPINKEKSYLTKLADDLVLSVQNAGLVPKDSKIRYKIRTFTRNVGRLFAPGTIQVSYQPLVYLFLDTGGFILDDVNDCKFAIKPGGSADYIWAFGGGVEYFHGKTRNIDVFTAYLINLSDSMKK